MAGERQVSVVETRSVTSGLVESAAEAKALDAAFDGVTESSKALTQAEISLESSVGRLDARFNESVRTANDVAKAQDTIARARAQGVGTEEQYARILTGVTERHEAALARQAAGLRQTGAAANDNAKTFGLAGHQVQNLTFQLNDLVTQIASGGGIFRPLIQQGGQVVQVLQQGEGGVGGVLRNIGASIAGIGPLALTAFGAAGVAGAVALAANALSNFQENLQRSEASVRSLTDSAAQANRVLAGAAEAAKGTRLLAEDLQQVRLQAETLANTSGRIEQLANGLTRLAPALNAQAFTQGVANIVSGMGASREEMQKMIGAVQGLGSKLTLTAGEAQKLARQFPELASLLAQAFGTTPQGLLQLPKQLEISTARLEELIAAAGKTKNASASILNFTDSITRLVVSIDNLLKLSTGWNFFWDNVAKGANKAADAIEKFLGKADEAAKAPAPSPQDPPRSTAWEPASGSSSRGGGGEREILYGRDISQTGEKTLREIHEGNVERQRAEEQAAYDRDAAQRQAERDANSNRTYQGETLASQEKQAASQAEQAAAQARRDEQARRYEEEMLEIARKDAADAARAGKMGYNWAGTLGAVDAFGKALDPARNSLNGLAAAAAKVTHSIIGRENTMAELFPVGFISWERQMTVEEGMQRDPRYAGLAAANAGWAPQTLRYEDFFGDPVKDAADDLDDFSSDFDDFSSSMDTASSSVNSFSRSMDDLGRPIQDSIDSLRDLQEAALSRVYRPDPYMEKNPEYFYTGDKIMKAGQDRIFDGLQLQIEKLQGLQALLGTLVNQNYALPQTLVDALVAAGFGNIAAQIVAAFNSMNPLSATPNPTAVLAEGGSFWRGVQRI